MGFASRIFMLLVSVVASAGCARDGAVCTVAQRLDAISNATIQAWIDHFFLMLGSVLVGFLVGRLLVPDAKKRSAILGMEFFAKVVVFVCILLPFKLLIWSNVCPGGGPLHFLIFDWIQRISAANLFR